MTVAQGNQCQYFPEWLFKDAQFSASVKVQPHLRIEFFEDGNCGRIFSPPISAAYGSRDPFKDLTCYNLKRAGLKKIRSFKRVTSVTLPG